MRPRPTRFEVLFEPHSTVVTLYVYILNDDNICMLEWIWNHFDDRLNDLTGCEPWAQRIGCTVISQDLAFAINQKILSSFRTCAVEHRFLSEKVVSDLLPFAMINLRIFWLTVTWCSLSFDFMDLAFGALPIHWHMFVGSGVQYEKVENRCITHCTPSVQCGLAGSSRMNSHSKFKCGGIFLVARITHNTVLSPKS